MLLGRTVRSLLALPERGFRRSDVLAVVTGAPLRHRDEGDGGELAPARAWERISRAAGVVDDGDWNRRLATFAAEQRLRAGEADRDERDRLAEHLRRDADRAEQLAAFVKGLRADLASVASAGSWSAMVEAVHALTRRYLGDERHRWRWPEEEQRAAERVEEALDRLAGLDAVAGPAGPDPLDRPASPSMEVFLRTLDGELEASLRRVGRFGDGVLVGHVSMAVGIELDRVIILGMAEGAFPPRRLEDSLLPDDERRAAGGELPLRAERVHDDHRQLLAAIAAATEATLSFPRGDLRRHGDRIASRWLLDDAAGLSSRDSGRDSARDSGHDPIFTDDLAALTGAWLSHVPSYAAGLARVQFPATSQELRLAAMLRDPRPVIDADPVLGLGVELVRARRSDQFTRFDGNLACLAGMEDRPGRASRPLRTGRTGHTGHTGHPEGPSLLDYTGGSATSATRLQVWAECPHAFFMQYLLGVEVVEDPERTLEMNPLDKGSLIHQILEKFVGEQIAAGRSGPWRGAERDRLLAIAEEKFEEYADRGVTGRALFWRRDRSRILADLERLAAEDHHGRPLHTELRFDDILFPLPDGRSVRFRGAMDRVDDTGDGSARVTDYKTGSTRGYQGLSADDPHQRGTHLQLAVYGTAAQQLLSRPTVDAEYWFITEKGNFQRIGYRLSPEIQSEVGAALATIVEGINVGAFPSGHRRARRTCTSTAGTAHPTARAPPKPAGTGNANGPPPNWPPTSGWPNRTCSMRTPDEPAREAVRTRLEETLFVEAGAGSGKTTCLVERFVGLVEAGVEADRIAAITFTEKAAAELADRIRTALQRRAPSSMRCRNALQALDRAAICTLHAFAQRLLSEHPIEAGLPPRFAVLEEIGSQLAFEARWETFVDRIIEDPDLERPLRLLLAAGARIDHLHQVAVQFGDNWDLVVERSGDPTTEIPPLELDGLLAEVDTIVAMGGRCRDADDKLLSRLDQLAQWGSDLRAATDDDSRLERLERAPSFLAGRLGTRGNWPDIEEVRDRVRTLEAVRDHVRDAVAQACLQRVAAEIGRFTVEAAEQRKVAGELEFHDLLVLARALLRDPVHGTGVRAAVADRYQRLLLDEFQDTDPIQVELAVLIASHDPDAASRPWSEIEVEPGRLFFVGDPKQSIYRFRRADIGVFLEARDTVGGRVEELTANFRTAEPILQWINHTFAQLIMADGQSQPGYVALDPVRGAATSGPAVSFMGCALHPKAWRADDLREAEAADVAAAIRAAVDDGWSVGDQRTGEWRPAGWADIAVLLPARTSLRALERALEEAGIPYRAETSSLVYGTGEIRDVLMVARAVEDPTDSLAVAAALRTPAFGCGDDDLYTWRNTYGGSWDHQRPLPDGAPVDHVVAESLAWLGGLHRQRLWLSPSQVLERIVRERRLMELASLHPRPRDLWRRLRFVVDQCRAWEEAGGRTLREYLAWVRLQAAEGARVVETVLPETDEEAVRILTIHGAKGLEFPITVLSGMTTQLATRPRRVQVFFPPGAGWAVHLKKDLETAEFTDYQPIDEQMDRHERLRLLYVAATRARDHLIVSVHRKENTSEGSTAASLFYETGWDPVSVEELPPAQPYDEGGLARPRPARVAPVVFPELPSFAVWEQQRSAALASATRPVAVSATRLAEEADRAARLEVLGGAQKDPRDIDLPPWQKGRYGSAVGRAVHAVLQSVDLVTGDGLEQASAAQAAAEGVLGNERVIEAFCRSALAADVVRRAAQCSHWREVYVGIPWDGGVLEGYIDLLYREDDGLVVVDYKTDAWRTKADLDAKVARYRVQLEAYGSAVAGATGEVVSGLQLLFLNPRGAPRVVTVQVPRRRTSSS